MSTFYSLKVDINSRGVLQLLLPAHDGASGTLFRT